MRRILVLTIAAIGLFFLAGAGPAVQAEEAGRDPFAPADPERRPIGAVRLTVGSGGPITFPIYALSAGVRQGGTAAAGAGTGSGRVTFDNLAVLKLTDAATTRLWQIAASAQALQRVEIALCPPAADCGFIGSGSGGPSADAYLVYTLEDVTVAAIDAGGSPIGGALTERITFAFAKITARTSAMASFCWQVRQNQTC